MKPLTRGRHSPRVSESVHESVHETDNTAPARWFH
ncbi:hypothetical protein bAD24_I02810 [Burkholderia sp. AD24]|nr:hypothetical protein bAD24_I02810 [Burkholderia sp. AD24]